MNGTDLGYRVIANAMAIRAGGKLTLGERDADLLLKQAADMTDEIVDRLRGKHPVDGSPMTNEEAKVFFCALLRKALEIVEGK